MASPVASVAKTGVEAVLDCLVVGGGPAGLTAATYLRRFHRSVVVFDDGRSRAAWIPESHNCPGFPQGVSGPDLLVRLRQQATEYGADILSSTIRSLRRTEDGWETGDGRTTWRARTVILATGVVDELPEIAGSDGAEAIRAGRLRLCAICDGYEATDRRIAVVGPLDKALGHACFLRAFSAHVTVVPTHSSPAAVPAELAGRAGALAIPAVPALRALSFEGDTCEVIDVEGNRHIFDTVYAAMGAPGRVDLARQAGVDLRTNGEIDTDDHMRTSVEGVYAIGDVVTDLNQIAVAFGHAAIAATAVHRALPPQPR